ncbi:MAG: polyphosphate polymerase domain-containing protein [Clostridia bacterium]|nr:polyphosphate polymerase domain-containing protein [Clostridia bacterium]
MAFKTVFNRYELKYMLTEEQKARLLSYMSQYTVPDKYKNSTIRNVYFDTESYRLIRRSMEKPKYKEKLRIRSYEKALDDSTVFVEIKKKYDHVVYKRRLYMTENDAMQWICNGKQPAERSQIGDEIDYFISFYRSLHPTVFLSYDREAFVSVLADDLRITFDTDIRARLSDLSLRHAPGGELLLPEGRVLMEIKTAGAIPLWLCRFLSEERLYKTSFSKYGTAYEKLIFDKRGT